ncbi:hypothetical protein BKA70DRAFT_680130 [Coprinopsis sp. MPI-PUGE-AT-0042]|nr:hypothetical protein BKA70DRAFT_680130 [Coprinopsis sp. MPI-PUGE-AT-0042]
MPQSSGQYQAPPQIIVLPSPSIDSGSSDSEDSYVVHGGRAAYPATYGSVSATSRTLSAAPYSKPSTMRRSGSGSTTPTTIRSETHNSTASPAILPASTRALAPPGLMSHPQSSYTSQFSVQPEQGATFYPSPQSPPMLGPHQQPRDLGQAPLRPPHQYDSVTSQPWRSAESPPQPPYMSPPHSLSQMSITSGFPRGTRPLDYAHAPATHARFMLSPSMSVMSAPGMASPPGGMSYRGYDQSLGGSMHSWVSPSGR